MARSTRHYDQHWLCKPFSLRVALRIIFVLGIGLIFCVTHLHLRFGLHQVRRETIRLQTLQGTLASEINALRGQTEALKQPEHLFEVARQDLGMTNYSPEKREQLSIPEEIHSRYALARASRRASSLAGDSTGMIQTGQWLAVLSERIGLTGEAQARETR